MSVPQASPGTGYHALQPEIDAAVARAPVSGWAQDIGSGVHYPVPVHLRPAYRGRVALGPSGCRATAAAAAGVLSLPMFPELTDAQVERVCTALRTSGQMTK